MRVLIACEFSGVVRRAFRAQGIEAWSCDLLPAEDDGPHIHGDVRDVLGWGWDLMVARGGSRTSNRSRPRRWRLCERCWRRPFRGLRWRIQ